MKKHGTLFFFVKVDCDYRNFDYRDFIQHIQRTRCMYASIWVVFGRLQSFAVYSFTRNNVDFPLNSHHTWVRSKFSICETNTGTYSILYINKATKCIQNIYSTNDYKLKYSRHSILFICFRFVKRIQIEWIILFWMDILPIKAVAFDERWRLPLIQNSL